MLIFFVRASAGWFLGQLLHEQHDRCRACCHRSTQGTVNLCYTWNSPDLIRDSHFYSWYISLSNSREEKFVLQEQKQPFGAKRCTDLCLSTLSVPEEPIVSKQLYTRTFSSWLDATCINFLKDDFHPSGFNVWKLWNITKEISLDVTQF